MDLHTLPTTIRGRVATAARHRLGSDTRSLAAFRIALGALLLSDLLLRSRDLVAFYTDSGVLPRAALISKFAHPQSISVHTASGEAWVQAALFLIAGGFALALLVGYRTSAVTIVSWVLLLSLHNRNPFILNGGDILLRLLLFWAMFLPLGERWSIDARRADHRRSHVVSVGTAAVLLQVVLMYGTNVAFKLSGDLWLNGTAMEYVFSLDQFTVLLGGVLAEYSALLHLLDWLWIAMLLLSPLLVVLTGFRRFGLVVLFVGMHVGMLLTMRLGLFPLIAVAGLLPFLPGAFWEAALPRVSGYRRVVSLGRWPAKLDGRLPADPAVEVPPRLGRWRRRLAPIVPATFLLLVVLWNLQTLGYGAVPDAAEPVIHTTQIDQYWNMFAPDPLRTDGWYVVPGQLENGSRIDALHLTSVRWDRPPDIATTYPNARWRKYLVNLWRPGYSGHRPYLGDYLCQRWNRQHENELVNVTLYFMEQPSRPFNDTEPIDTVQLARHRC